MATHPILGLDIYLALAAVGWADGKLTPEAADAIVRTALEEGLDLAEVGEIEKATKTPTDIGVVDRMGMSKADRLYVYAVASWIACLDGEPGEGAQGALAHLGHELGVPEGPRLHADAIMRQIALQDDRPARFDLRTLRSTLDECLEEASKARRRRRAEKDGTAEASGEFAPILDLQAATQADESPTVLARPALDLRHVVFLEPGPSWTVGLELREQELYLEHQAHWRKAIDLGRVELGGPFVDETGAMIVPSRDCTESELAAYAVEDPAVRAGILVFSLRRWLVLLKPVF